MKLIDPTQGKRIIDTGFGGGPKPPIGKPIGGFPTKPVIRPLLPPKKRKPILKNGKLYSQEQLDMATRMNVKI